ncbi:transporter substrate-binding domain-containing protein [Silvimonas amylolytica]|nr:transporter substrate-binding domain-containing protein [Silvimonas amylolytica]
MPLKSSLFVVIAALALPAVAGTLDQIASNGEVRIGYRQSSMPLSWSDNEKPTGFMVSLCEKIVTEQIGPAVHNKNLRIQYVPVTAQNRFDLLASGKIDMECGSTTVTRARLQQADFSLVTYITESRLVSLKSSGAQSLSTISGKTLAVQTGSSQAALIARVASGVKVLPVPDAAHGIAAVSQGKAHAYVDGEILSQSAIRKAGLPDDRFVYGAPISVEPFAIMTRKGDADFGQLIDAGLRKIFAKPNESLALLKGYSDQMGADINLMTREAMRNPAKGRECSVLEAASC